MKYLLVLPVVFGIIAIAPLRSHTLNLQEQNLEPTVAASQSSANNIDRPWHLVTTPELIANQDLDLVELSIQNWHN